MKLILDSEAQSLRIERDGAATELPLYSREAFEALSREWLRVGWAVQYYFTFSWLGSPVLQLPEDLVRLQEVLWRLQPDVIVETGIYSGGSLLFHATLCEAIGKGRVIGIDKSIDPAVHAAITRHRLGGRIAMIEGDSTAAETVATVRGQIAATETVVVILDSHHAKDHVLAELNSYAPLVSPRSCIIVTDGVMRDLADVPGGDREWTWDNPAAAATEFLKTHSEFEQRQPEWEFNRSPLERNITYWPEGWLWRR